MNTLPAPSYSYLKHVVPRLETVSNPLPLQLCQPGCLRWEMKCLLTQGPAYSSGFLSVPFEMPENLLHRSRQGKLVWCHLVSAPAYPYRVPVPSWVGWQGLCRVVVTGIAGIAAWGRRRMAPLPLGSWLAPCLPLPPVPQTSNITLPLLLSPTQRLSGSFKQDSPENSVAVVKADFGQGLPVRHHILLVSVQIHLLWTYPSYREGLRVTGFVCCLEMWHEKDAWVGSVRV